LVFGAGTPTMRRSGERSVGLARAATLTTPTYSHQAERTKDAIAEGQKFSALLKMLCAGQPTHQFPQGGFAKPIELQPFV
jgi:hypothetical protein